MSGQNSMKFLKFISNYRQVLSHVNYATLYSNLSFKVCTKMNYSLLPSASFGTSMSRWSDDEPNVINEDDCYYFEAGRSLAKHVEDPNMPKVKIILVTKDGKEIGIEARVGMTVLKAALKYNAPIEAACEAKKACTTCHCYVDENIRDYFTPADLDEEDLLDVAPFCKPTSRLSCQMKIVKKFDCVRIHLPLATVNFAVDKKNNEEETVVQ